MKSVRLNLDVDSQNTEKNLASTNFRAAPVTKKSFIKTSGVDVLKPFFLCLRKNGKIS